MIQRHQKSKIVVVCGPTAIGKTTVGIELAEKFGSEIISADSMQIYKRMDIGTAKPTPEEVARVSHHLIDVVEPDKPFDAVQYSKMAREIIRAFHNQGKIPFVVGGTGLYIKALLHGLYPSQTIDPAVRERLKTEADKFGSGSMHARLNEIDPETAARLHPNDTYRILRALETVETTGQPISQHHREHGFSDTPYNSLKIGLHMERQQLYERINLRVDIMLANGLVDEVKRLLDMGYSRELKSMQSIGYHHMVEYIQNRLEWDEAVRTLKRDTRRFAKRQFTWFRADPDIIWKEPQQLDEMITITRSFIEAEGVSHEKL